MWVLCLMIVVVSKLVAAKTDWECSEDCPNYKTECNDGRALKADEEYTPAEEEEEEPETIADNFLTRRLASHKSLRGKTKRRQLDDDDYFQLKLHWEKDYCVSSSVDSLCCLIQDYHSRRTTRVLLSIAHSGKLKRER